MTKTPDHIPATELSDDDLDAVQGAGNRVQQASTKGVILSSEGREPSKGVVLSSESHEPTFKRDAKGIVLSSETENPRGK
ncbi:hypothetical protein KUL25_08605 [Rhodobacteraceae bacterium N5(2021)]|uniref:Uncharacterized protein n=1 Tax=Gymnodinialimonas phycosphaerae TaxID=2841589 RepID=A0A975TY23_9RHOB|nr:hypothetical protein [Gymnodinialimonas phycosphaerae]MBY4892823.1 hypothetical protein [Gymnodinialimonas phycosphaerae]